eukprot:1277012-Pleurochrysis_carterae.AAC.1
MHRGLLEPVGGWLPIASSSGGSPIFLGEMRRASPYHRRVVTGQGAGYGQTKTAMSDCDVRPVKLVDILFISKRRHENHLKHAGYLCCSAVLKDMRVLCTTVPEATLF